MTADTLGVCGHDHLVQFYASDEFLVQTVCAFLVPALRDGDAAIVAATSAHRHAFDSALEHAGIDVEAAVREGRYVTFEASDLLSQFIVAGAPDATRFRDTIGAVMDHVSGDDGRTIRVYGEMVALLYEDGDVDSAVALEDLWNDLADSHAFELLCGYPMRLFADDLDAAAFAQICDRHSAVIPCDGYPTLAGPVEQSRSVAKLQQEVAMLARGHEQSLRNQSILDSAGDGIFGTDTNGALTFANPAAVRMTGYARDEFAGRHLHTLLHHAPDETGAALDADPDEALSHGRHDVFGRKDGTSFPVEYSSTPIVDGDRTTGAVVVFRDITDRLEADRVKDEFTSVVSHELRTPLTSIRASLGLLESGVLGTLPAEGQRMLPIAVRNTDRLVRLIGDILDIERIDSGAMQLQSTPCDAGELVGCAIDAVLATAVEAEVRIDADAEPAAFAGDSDRLIQTLTNLIANAVKFSPRGSTVRVTSESRGGEMRFEVSDHGRGIPSHKLETIFERFTQVDSADALKRRGTGLGLAICRSIVERHGGRIWARSVPGEGSTFTFVIPMQRSDDHWYTPAACTPQRRPMPDHDDVRSAA